MIKEVFFKDLSKHEQQCIYSDVMDDIRKNDASQEKTEHDGNIIVFNYSIDYEHEIKFDEDECTDEIEYKILKYSVEDFLNSKNIKFESSKTSESIYFDYNNKNYRVSTHKRPSVYDDLGNYSHDHNYENEIIGKDEVELYEIVERIING